MNRITASPCLPWVLSSLMVLMFVSASGCSGKGGTERDPIQGSNCFAKALPTAGEGGLAWGDTLHSARKKSLNSCMRYAGRSGGTPGTCQVVLAKCRTR